MNTCSRSLAVLAWERGHYEALVLQFPHIRALKTTRGNCNHTQPMTAISGLSSLVFHYVLKDTDKGNETQC